MQHPGETTSGNGNEIPEGMGLPAVFNKRLFAAQGSVTITPKARSIMNRNNNSINDVESVSYLSKSELQAMRCVVDGLKLIHKNHDYVKDVLCHVITMETYGPNRIVVKKPWEETLSCYYIVCGAVEVRYDVVGEHSRNVYQSDIVYNHGTGEYLGIVNLEGRDEDIGPPSSVHTKELTQFLRIDRTKFHKMVQNMSVKIKRDFMKFLSDSDSIFKSIPPEDKEKILPKLEVQEYRPNRIILNQGQRSNYLYFVISGRCRCNRRVCLPEAGKEVLFYLCCKEKDEFFGEECVLDNELSYNTVTAITHVMCYRLHKSAFDIVKGGLLTQIVQHHRDGVLTEEELQSRGYQNSIWNYYKHTKVKEPLKERGHLQYMTRNKAPRLADRPPTPLEQYRENMLRFKEKGFKYEPVRPRTAVYRRPKSSVSVRTRSARPRTTSPRMFHLNEELYDSDQESVTTEPEEEKETPNKAMSDELLKLIQKHDGNLEDETIEQILEENQELARHLQKSLEGTKSTVMNKENFMKNTVLATMKSEDIVRKAMAMADKKAENMKRGKKTEEEEWSNVLQAENRQAKVLISVNKMKVSLLRKQLDDIENKRAKSASKQQKKQGFVKGHLLDKHTFQSTEYPVNDVLESYEVTENNSESYDIKQRSKDSNKKSRLRNFNDADDESKPKHDKYLETMVEDESETSLQGLDRRLRPIDDLTLGAKGIESSEEEGAISARF